MTRSAVSVRWRAFAFAALLILALPSAAQDDEAFAEEMDAHLDALEQQNASDALTPLPTMQAPAGGATGPAAEVARVVRDMINEMSGVQNVYVRRIAEIGLERLLDPVRLDGDRGMAEGRRMIAEARAAADTAKADSLGVLDAFPDRIRAAALGDRDRAEMLKGAERSLPTARERIERQFDLELAAYREMSSLLDLLATVDWEYADDRMVFADDAHVDAYNGLLAKLDAIVAEQSRSQSEQIEEARGKLQQLRD